MLPVKSLLEAGEVVAIPTETVYGLAGNAYNEVAVCKIFQTKQRPRFDPLIVHASCIEQIGDFVKDFPPEAQDLAKSFWPGPLTLLLPKKAIIPDAVTAGLHSVAVRVPNHPLTLALLRTLSFPLAAPSANLFGYISPTTPQHVYDQLGEKVPYIVDGGTCRVGIESTIVGFDQGRPAIYRLGGISVEAIEEIIGPIGVVNHAYHRLQVPGGLLHHYAPQKPLKLGKISMLIEQHSRQRLGILAFDHYYEGIDPHYQVVLAPTASLEEAAQNLFAALRKLDAMPLELILATYVPNVGLGRAINERLSRAASVMG
ncbi:MAG: L-threonylcarbamoyladenylate synthase [Bacteroidota bacterium]